MTIALKYYPVQDESPKTEVGIPLSVANRIASDASETHRIGALILPRLDAAARDSSVETSNSRPAVETTQETVAIPVVVSIPRPRDPEYRLQLLQQWECVVREVNESEFVATLYDLKDRSLPEEEGTFLVDDVSDADRGLLWPGAVFYWSIGYRTNSSGQKERLSMIRFRRLPSWGRRERREADKYACDLVALLSP